MVHTTPEDDYGNERRPQWVSWTKKADFRLEFPQNCAAGIKPF
jgi:hypothetical protein